mgnify:CR=1 FL=1
MEYHDKIQAQTEASLLNAFGGDPTFRARVDDEQIVGATMLRYNIFYSEAKKRVAQALKSIKVSTK